MHTSVDSGRGWHNCKHVEAFLGPLLPLYERERAAGRAVALAVLAFTAGSTYSKAGALMLIAANGDYAGLLSGGCLEGDLREHARSVIATGTCCPVRYDMRGPEDQLWGLGMGCEGAMQILLLRVGPDNDWQPVAELARSLATHTATAIGVVVESRSADVPLGSLVLPGRTASAAAPGLRTPAVAGALIRVASSGHPEWIEGQSPSWKLFVLPLALPPRILLLGAGPDAAPVVEFATMLNWRVTLVDHRSAYAVAAHFPTAERVLLARPEELGSALELSAYCAAVVMSHHLTADLGYLRVLAASNIPYVGLLGPAVRRERLLAELGPHAEPLRGRLHAPVGLPLGGRMPQSIALAIIAELHAFVHAPTARRAADS
jgi:xanthine/CO dehydrogenase XdhC/CoxF family maturation factor